MVLPNVHSLGYKAGRAVYHLYSNHTLPEVPTLTEISDFIRSMPSLYKDWWLNLVTKDPVHVFVETGLLISIVLMIMVQKRKDWREDNKDNLTEAEKEELLQQWREHERRELAPPETREDMSPNVVVVHANRGRTMDIREGDDGEMKTVLNFATYDFLGMASSCLTTDSDGPAWRSKMLLARHLVIMDVVRVDLVVSMVLLMCILIWRMRYPSLLAWKEQSCTRMERRP